MRGHAIFIVVIAAIVTAQGQEPPAADPLLRSVRAGDTEVVEQLLRTGADPNTRDTSGATALMYAAAFAPAPTMRVLMAAGADVNATSRNGATALMWATHDAVKVRLLLEKGAAVNAARADGATALVAAALRGDTSVVETLLNAGADVKIGRVAAPWPSTLLQIALTTNDPSLHKLFTRSDGSVRNVADATPPLTRLLLTSVYSWRPQPLTTTAGTVNSILDAGADPNEIVNQMVLSVPALSRAAQLGDVEAMRVLLHRGANPNLKGSGGLTPLMVAAVASADPAMVRLLLDSGASVDARDDRGQTALDWALRLGETGASRVLHGAGATSTLQTAALPTAVAHVRSPKDAVERALARLQPAGPGFASKTRCISCHNQSLPSVAVTLASAKGAAFDHALSSHPTQSTLAVWARHRENMLLGHCSVFGFLGNVTYGLFGLAEEGVAPGPETDAVTSCLSGLQKPNGSWDGGDTRPPLAASNPFVYTALAVRGLKSYAPPGRHEDTAARIERARSFLVSATPSDTQEEAFKLLGLIWADASAAEISTQTKRVRDKQRRDGGWSQLPTMAPDAYATGQALYALRVAGTSSSSDSYRTGLQFLLRTQLEDGTWFVRSRAIGFQPYVDSGFPHGPDQFISAAATAWAVIALSHAL